MNNLNSVFTPQALCDQTICNKELTIPLYQRLFVWGEEQIEKLLKDLEKAAQTSNPYYIGIITIVEKNNTWEVVDGQQRLAFLTLFGCECMRKKLRADDWNNFIFQDNDKLRIHYFARQEDEDDIRNMAVQNSNINKIKNPNFYRFRQSFESFFSKITEEMTMKFANYVYQKTSFLISELPSKYSTLDLNKFFEKMNAAGRQLEPVDVVKGKHFAAFATTWNACMDFSKLYIPSQDTAAPRTDSMTLSDILDAPVTEIKDEEKSEFCVERYSKRSILKPTIFLLHILSLTVPLSTIPLDSDNLIEIFDDNKDKLGSFIDMMQGYRQWLDKNIIYLRNNDDMQIDEYAFRDEDEDEDSSKEKWKHKQFQAMLYVSSDERQQWVLKAFQNGNTLTLEDLKKQNKRSSHHDKMTYSQIDRYWFWYLDYLLWESYIEQNSFADSMLSNLSKDEQAAISNYRFQRNRSIEHLHPQNPENESQDWRTDRDDNADVVRNGVGNLAMISSSFNSVQSNDSIGVKFARLRDTQIPEKKLESIKMLLMFKLAGGKESDWTIDTAQKHREDMLALLENTNNVEVTI